MSPLMKLLKWAVSGRPFLFIYYLNDKEIFRETRTLKDLKDNSSLGVEGFLNNLLAQGAVAGDAEEEAFDGGIRRVTIPITIEGRSANFTLEMRPQC